MACHQIPAVLFNVQPALPWKYINKKSRREKNFSLVF
uniref:Uncharacterized protein n=1 Tax=Rhizophora mucronata TaxID=61149 RepID=A0A2P2PGY2_RHIMU